MKFLLMLFVKKDKVSVFLRSMLLYMLLIYTFGFLLNYGLTSNVSFSIGQWIENFQVKYKAILLLFIVYNFVVILFLLFLYFRWRYMYERTNLIVLKLEDVSHLWTRYNNEVKTEKKSNKLQNDLDYSDIDFIKKSRAYKRFYTKYIFEGELIKHIEYYKKAEIYFIIKILDAYEAYGECSSVASQYKNDDEKNQLSAIIKEANGGKQNYTLLSTVSLGEHVRNVLEIMISKYMIDKSEYDNAGYTRVEVVLAAILHDIGKIFKSKDVTISDIDEAFLQGGHTEVSIKWINLIGSDEDIYWPHIIKAIKEHHYSHLPADPLSALLYQSDKEARKKETEKVLAELRQQEKEEYDKKIKALRDGAAQEPVAEKETVAAEEHTQPQNEEKPMNAQKKKQASVTPAENHIDQGDAEAIDYEQNPELLISKVIALLKENMNLIREKPYERPLIGVEDIEKSHILSLANADALYFSYSHLKGILEQITNKQYTKPKIKEFTDAMFDRKMLVKAPSMDMHQVSLIIDGVPFKEPLYLFKIPLEKISVNHEYVETTKSRNFKLFNIQFFEKK
jgi:HD superfamily phosphohydrolase YqeK